MTTIRISTYAIYNAGSLRGFDLDLDQCYDQEDIDHAIAAGLATLGDPDPEIMIQDVEGHYVIRKIVDRLGVGAWLYNLHEYTERSQHDADRLAVDFEANSLDLAGELEKEPDLDLEAWTADRVFHVYDADNAQEALQEYLADCYPETFKALNEIGWLFVDWKESAAANLSPISTFKIDGRCIHFIS